MTNSFRTASVILLGVVASCAPLAAQKVPSRHIGLSAGSIAGRRVKPDLAVAGRTVHVVWGRETDSVAREHDIRFTRSLDGGNTWTPEISLSGVFVDVVEPEPKIAAAGDSVYVVWNQRGASTTGLARGLWLRRSTDRGATWSSPPVQLATSLQSPFKDATLQIAVDASAVHVAWGVGTGVRFRNSLDGGQTWSDLQVLGFSVAGEAVPRLAVAGALVHVVWGDGPNRDVFVMASVDRGVTWPATPTNVNATVSSRVDEVDIAATGNRVYVTWSESFPSQGQVWVTASGDGGATWLPMPRYAGDGSMARVACEGNNAYLVWREWLTSDDIVFDRSVDGGNSWLPAPVTLNPGLGAGGHAEVATSNGVVAVGWQTGGVYCNYSTDGGLSWRASEVYLDTWVPPSGLPSSDTPVITVVDGQPFAVWSGFRGPEQAINFNIPFGSQKHGIGTAGTGGFVPAMETTGLPIAGSTMSVEVGGALGGTVGAWLVGGPGDKTWTWLPSLAGTLFVVPEFSLPLVTSGTGAGDGEASLSLPVPAQAALLGADFYFQAILADPGAPRGVTLSDAIELWIG